MSSLEILITEYLSDRSGLYYIRQCLVIMALFVFGAILTDLMMPKEQSWIRRSVLAFPAGLSAFVITAYALLVAGIPYNTATVCITVIAETAVAVYLNRKSFAGDFCKAGGKHMLTAAAAATVIAVVACRGIAPVSISNDTLYYFKRYPDSIVFYGSLRDQFDCWLTDTGLGVVCGGSRGELVQDHGRNRQYHHLCPKRIQDIQRMEYYNRT